MLAVEPVVVTEGIPPLPDPPLGGPAHGSSGTAASLRRGIAVPPSLVERIGGRCRGLGQLLMLLWGGTVPGGAPPGGGRPWLRLHRGTRDLPPLEVVEDRLGADLRGAGTRRSGGGPSPDHSSPGGSCRPPREHLRIDRGPRGGALQARDTLLLAFGLGALVPPPVESPGLDPLPPLRLAIRGGLADGRGAAPGDPPGSAYRPLLAAGRREAAFPPPGGLRPWRGSWESPSPPGVSRMKALLTPLEASPFLGPWAPGLWPSPGLVACGPRPHRWMRRRAGSRPPSPAAAIDRVEDIHHHGTWNPSRRYLPLKKRTTGTWTGSGGCRRRDGQPRGTSRLVSAWTGPHCVRTTTLGRPRPPLHRPHRGDPGTTAALERFGPVGRHGRDPDLHRRRPGRRVPRTPGRGRPPSPASGRTPRRPRDRPFSAAPAFTPHTVAPQPPLFSLPPPPSEHGRGDAGPGDRVPALLRNAGVGGQVVGASSSSTRRGGAGQPRYRHQLGA